MIKYYAKSHPRETIEEHTQKLFDVFEEMKEKGFLSTGLLEKYDRLVTIALKYHDYGKVNYRFQNKIGNEKEKVSELDDIGEIPHNVLSLCFLTKSVRSELGEYKKLMMYVIAYHHNRFKNADLEKIERYIEHDLDKKKGYFAIDEKLKGNIDVDGLDEYIWRESSNREKYFEPLVFIKGLLHKCDYCASGDIEAEQLYNGDYSQDFRAFLDKKGFSLRPHQEEAGELKDKSVILIASTGSGKTEYSMNWIGGGKAFYLLGLKAAVNAMYDRFCGVFGDENTALLHGESSYNLLDFYEDDGADELYNRSMSMIKNMTYPITVATADQLVTAVFKYNGFELPYFIASYSKIVVDEIQSFSPESIAAIVVFLKEVSRLGAKFLLMTATLPDFIKEEFVEIDAAVPNAVLSPTPRHKILCHDFDIEDALELILEQYDKHGRVLIVCNTVSKAQKIYEHLRSKLEGVKLIHSRFTRKDRALKEKEVLADGQNYESRSIWVSTQIVEASLDIDFDVLFTESAGVDSLFQRFGRCYRKREYRGDEANVHIFSSNDKVYENGIRERSFEKLKEYDLQIVSEEDKQDIIKYVYDKEFLEDTKYMKKYRIYKTLLQSGFHSTNKDKAQYLFRKISNNYKVIPEDIVKDNEDVLRRLISEAESKETGKIEKMKARRELSDYFISVQLFDKRRLTELPVSSGFLLRSEGMFMLCGCRYSYEEGLQLNAEQESNFI